MVTKEYKSILKINTVEEASLKSRLRKIVKQEDIF